MIYLMLQDLQARLGFQFTQPQLLKVALTHRSYHFEHKDKSCGHFERMEFLGDAVLDLLMSEMLMSAFPEVEEGVLSKWRASLVNEQSLSHIASELDLIRHFRLGRSESLQRDNPRPRLLASALEAILAAVYQDGGLEAARRVVSQLFAGRLNDLDPAQGFAADFKTRLQEWTQKRYRCTPDYRLLDSEGPEHAKRFRFEVLVGGEVLGQGAGGSRKSAEQEAARQALLRIEEIEKGEKQ